MSENICKAIPKEKKVATKQEKSYLSYSTYPVFVIYHITQHIIKVQNAAIPMFQPVDLNPIAGVLEKNEKETKEINKLKGEKGQRILNLRSAVMRSALLAP